MVYAVACSVYRAFRTALGRSLAWGFDDPRDEPGDAPRRPGRLRLRPHALRESNAYYGRDTGDIRFGYYRTKESGRGRIPRGGYVFACLSHDIVAHEVTHAVLDGLRGHYTVASRPDVPAFHEALADLVAVFRRFGFRAVVAAGIRQSQGQIARAPVLTGIANQFGYTKGDHPMRMAIEDLASGGPVHTYETEQEVHARGSVLVSAVFEAFCTLFERKTARYLRLATGGTGMTPPGSLPGDLQHILADEVSDLAGQILSICIRAVDYCPPVDLEFGDFLRAMITADTELVPDDPWAYREALVDAFTKRGIFPRGLRNLAEDSLRWNPPWRRIEIPALGFARLQFDGDPGRAAGAAELERQARALGEVVAADRDTFGVAADGDPRLGGHRVGPITIESIRSARRVGPDGQVLFDLVAEVVQARSVPSDGGAWSFLGGSTVIVDPRGVVRYVIRKNILDDRRLAEQQAFRSGAGQRLAMADGTARPDLFALLHESREKGAAPE
jgi:hypothetical protein